MSEVKLEMGTVVHEKGVYPLDDPSRKGVVVDTWPTYDPEPFEYRVMWVDGCYSWRRPHHLEVICHSDSKW